MKVAPSVLSRIAATKAVLEQKFHLRIECVVQGRGNPRWRDDDLTSNVFGSDARVDTLARCVGVVASRGSARWASARPILEHRPIPSLPTRSQCPEPP